MGKQGKLYIKFVVAVAILAAAIYSYTAVASAPTATPFITNNNASLPVNVSVARVADKIFFASNFSSENASTEVNSTFKWFKRTLYQPQNRSLVGYWKLDGNANDSSPAAANHGTVINATPNQSQDCRIDECLYFDGVDDFINFSSVTGTSAQGGALSFLDSNDFTLELWYKGNDSERNGVLGKTLIGRDDSDLYGHLALRDGFAVYAHYDSKLIHINSTTNVTADNKWHHIAYVNYNNETGRLYVDGVLEATASSSFSDANKYFKANGLMRGFNNKYTRGSIDEVAIYSYAKSAAEISADYRNSPYSAMIYRDAVAYWHFDSVNGSNVTFDSSGRGNNGNLSGFNQSNATTAGIIGSGLKFDGIDDYVGLGNPRLFGGNVSNASITFWVKPADSWNTDSHRDFIFTDIASSVGIQLTAMEDNGDLRVLVGNGTQATVYFADVNWKKDVWTHIGIAYNGTHFLFYQDGSLASVNATTLRSIGESEVTTAAISIVGNPSVLNGTLDEFAIYNRTLSAEDVRQLYLRTWYDHSPQQFLLHPSYPDQLNNDTQNTTLLLHFDEGVMSSPNVSDSSPYGNNGNISGANFTNDSISGSALVFDGSANYVNVSDVGRNLDITGDITIMAWIKARGWPAGGEPGIITKRNAFAGLDWELYYENNIATPELRFGDDGSFTRLTGSGRTLANNTWYHVAVTKSGGAANNLSLYLNGALIATDFGVAFSTGDTVRLGVLGADTIGTQANQFNGTIDEVKIVNRSLTAAEIAADYRKGCPFCSSDGELPIATSGVVWQPGRFVDNLTVDANVTGYWRFDNGLGQNVSDISGKGNSAVLGVDGNSGTDEPVWVNDSVSGFALDFDNSNDFVNATPANLPVGNDNYTIAAWIKPDIHTDADGIVGWGNWGALNQVNAFRLGLTGSTFQLVNYWWSNDFIVTVYNLSGAWHQVVATFNGTVRTMYLDGVKVGSNSPGTTVHNVANKDFRIGSTNGGEWFDGKIDEVIVLNRSWTSDEVLANYRKAAKGIGLLKNSYINYSATGNFNEREGTVEFWVKPEWNGNDNLAHVFFDTETAADFNVSKTTGNDLAVYFGNPGSALVKSSISGWTSGYWRHVGVAWNNYTSNVTLLVDGSVVNNSGTAFVIPAAAAAKSYLIGARAPGTSDWANATISEFRISRKALTAQEINESFSKGRQFYSNEYLLNSSNYQKGDSFTVQYTPGDSQATTGNVSNSSILTIVNSNVTEPTVTDFGLAGIAGSEATESVAANKASSATPLNATFLSQINITWNPSADNDSETVSYAVLINNTLVCATTATSCNTTQLPSWTSAAGAAFYIFNVTASDGEMNASTTTYAFNFDNSTPTVSIVALTAANNTFQNTTSYNINFTVTEASLDKVLLNITGPSFAGTGGDGSLSGGRNITLWDKDLVLMLHFEEGNSSNATTNDSSGFGNSGNLFNMNASTVNVSVSSGPNSSGRFGGGMAFDGINDYIKIPYSVSLQPKSAITLTAWVYISKLGPGYQSVIQYPFNAASHTDPFFEYAIYISNAGAVHTRIDGEASSNFGTVAAGTWNHVAVVWDGSTTIVTFYVNGTSVGTYDGTKTSITYDSNNPVLIGANADGAERVNGTLDEVKIWRRALTTAEISAEYNRTASNYLVAHNFSGSTHIFSLNMTNLSNGNYSYFAWVNDSSSQSATTAAAVATTAIGQREFKIDTVAPSISLAANTPANASVLGSSFIFINTSENDAGNNHNDFSAFVDFNNSLVGYWRFEDTGNGTHANDSSSYGNNGAMTNFGCLGLNCNLTGGKGGTGSGWTSGGKRGRALLFDGQNDYVELGNTSASLNISGTGLTMSFWMMASNSQATAYAALFGRYMDTNALASYYIARDGSNNRLFALIANNTNQVTPTLGTGVFDSKWHYIALTYNGTAIATYTDGVLDSTTPFVGDLKTNSTHNFRIGAGDDGSGGIARPFNGSIDDVMVWRRALSAQEINATYHAGVYRLQNNFTGLADGNYTYRAYSVDAAGNVNQTEARNFTVDAVAPTIAYVEPTVSNNSFVNKSWTVINTSVSESGESSAFINFNSSLVGYWRFEDDGDTNASDFSSYNNNGSLVGFGCTAADCNLTGGAGGVASGFVSSGKRGKALAFDGNETSFVNAGNATSLNPSEITLEAWAKANGFGSWNGIVTNKPGANYGLNLQMGITRNIASLIGNGTSFVYAQTSWAPLAGVWYHVVVIHSNVTNRLYVNGKLEDTQTFWLNYSLPVVNTTIGCFYYSSTNCEFPFNGSIDEVKVWNRALNETEINASFQAGTYRLFKNFTGLPDANYSFNVSVVDWAGSLFTNDTRSVIVDTTLPLISFGLGSDANGTSLARNYVHLNVSVDELNPRNLTATLFSGAAISAQQNVSVNKTPGFNNITFLSVSDGYYNVSVSVRDLADNVNSTVTNRSFTVDTTAPVLAYAAPSFANASFVNVSWIFLNFSFTEANNDTFMIRNGSTNWTGVNRSVGYFFYNFTDRTDGNYTFFGWVNDTSSNVAQTVNRTIIVDTVVPAISLIANTPANASVLGSSFIFINTSENDAGNDHNDFSAFVDFNNSLVGYWRFEEGSGTNATDFTGNANHGNMTNFGCTELNCNLTGGKGGTGSGWTSGGKRGRALLFDGQNDYVNVSGLRFPDLDSNNWTVSLWTSYSDKQGTNSGQPGLWGTDGSHTLYLDVNSGVQFYWGGTTISYGILTNNTWNHYAVTRNGINFTLYVNGVRVGVGNSSVRATVAGFLLGTAATGGAYTLNGSIDDVMVWRRALNESEVNASYSAGIYRLSANLTGLNDGNYTYRAFVVDAAGNVNQTEARNFTVDTVAPTVAYVEPTVSNNSFVNKSWTVVNTSVSESGESSAFINFNSSLVGYWRFEDDGDTNASDFTSNNNNGTMVNFGCTAADCNLTGVGGVASGFVSSGKRGKALALNGINNFVNVSNVSFRFPDADSSDWTVELWVMRASKQGTNSGQPGYWALNGTQTLYTLANGSVEFFWDTRLIVSPFFANDTWAHYAVTRSGNTFILYFNGANAGSATSTIRDTGNNFMLGTQTGSGYFLNGSIDEVKVWRRALNWTEVNASYHAGTYRLFRNFSGLPDGNYSFNVSVVDWAGSLFTNDTRSVIVDTTLPLISFGLGSDANGTSLARDFIHLNVSVDELNPRNLTATLFSGAAISAQQNISANKTPGFNNITFSSVADGYYNISVSVGDLADNVNSTITNRSFTVDTTQPLIDNGTNINSQGFRNVDWAFINYTFTEVNNDTIYVRNGSSGVVMNTTPNRNATYFWYNFTNLDNANYTFSGWINDTAGRVNATANTSVVIDTVFPTISFGLGSDANGTSFARNYIHLNITVTDVYGRNLTATLFSGAVVSAQQNVSVNTTGGSPGFNNITFVSVADGYYNVSISVRDFADNVNTTSTNRSFTVDTTEPVVAYAAPSFANASFVNVSWIFLNFSFTETNNDTFMIRNGSTNWTGVNRSVGYFFYNFTDRSDGNYTFFGWVNDTSSNVAQTVNRTIVVDTKGPDITYDASSFANASLVKFVTINVSANDSNNDHNDLSAFVDFNGSLIGYWRFEEGEVNVSNRSVLDFSSYGNRGNLTNFGCLDLNCNLTGGTYETGSGWASGGKRGRGILFDGADDLVNISDTARLRLTGNLTLEGWIYPRVAPAAGVNYAVVGKATTGTIDYLLFINATHVGFNSTAQGISSAVRAVPVGAWSHVAASFDGANIRIYVNGLLNATVAQTAALSTTTGHLAIGSHGGNAASFFNGTIDEVKIWNRTLSAQEINASFSAGNYRLLTNITVSTDVKYADGNFTYTAYVVDAAGNVNAAEQRLVVLDNSGPAINAIRTLSNMSGFYYQVSNSTSAVVAYFNSIAPAGTGDGGGGQAVTIEVTYTDLYRNSLSGNLTFGMIPLNHTALPTSTITYNISSGSGNATALVMANDTANNTATATVRFILDMNDTVTTDNSTVSTNWVTTNVTVNLTAVDAANGSGANRTLWCTFTAGTTPCTPTVEVFNPSADFRLPLNCSTGSSCQIRVRYYSMDNVSNNESGGSNGGSVRESNSVNIGTGGSDVNDTLANNTAILNGSFVRASNLTNSTVNNCRVTGSVVVRSVLFRNIDHFHNCTVSDSFVLDSNITSSIIEKQSYVDPSIITDSVITNSTIHNSTVSYSRIENSTFCGNFSVWTAAILNNTLIDGRVTFNGSNYFGPASLSSICAGTPSSPVGSFVADPSVVNNSAALVFRYTSASTGYTLTIGQPELFGLDNTSTKSITLNDNGTYPDAIANDAVYSGNYSISALNNQTDGNKTIVAQVSDNLGNNWTVRTNVTLDKTAPSAAIVVNSNNLNTTSTAVALNVTFSDAIGVKDCRFANEDRVFGSYETCNTVKSWTLSSGNGLKTVVVQVRDAALNVNETNDTISLLGSGTAITAPVSGDIIKGSRNVVVIAPDIAAWVTFTVINATNSTQNWSLSGAVGGITNDTNPGDGFVQPWTTTLFGNESLFNITAISYGASGSFLSNDTQGNIQVDNAPPNVTIDIPKASTAYNKLVRVNASASNDTVSVRFDYRTSSTADWSTIGTAYVFPYTVDWNTVVLADGTAYEVRANATDDAGWSSLSTHTSVELDNTGPSVSITAPVAGSSVSGTFNITFTILGTVLSRAIQFDGGLWQAPSGNASHLWDTTTVANGAHLIRVQANDTLNNTGYSEIVIAQVDNGGANVILLSPSSGGYKSGNVTLEVSAPGNTFNVTFNISNSTGFFNTTAVAGNVSVDNVSSDGWTASWVTTLFAEDGTYTVAVAAYAANNTLLGTDSATSIEVDNLAPNNVTNLTILPHPNSNSETLTLNWTSSTSADLDHYNLHRSQSGNFTAGSGTFVKSVGSNTTTDNVPAGTWFYRVVAVDNVGRESNVSNEVNSTVILAGPTGGMDINASYARNNDTIKLAYTGSGTGFTVIVNASEMMKLDARVLHDFEKLWSTSNNNSLNLTLNSTATKAGTFSMQLRTNESGALNENVTVDLSAAGIVNLSSYNRLVLWVRSNITGNVLNLTFGTDNYTQAGNFTVTVDAANTWEHKAFDISGIPVNGSTGNRSSIRYLMLNVTTATPMRLLVDDLEASNQVSLVDDGTGVDSLADDSTYTGSYNITFGQNVTDGLKTVRALVTDGSGNTLAPSDTITLDNTAPFSAVIINEGDLFTTSRAVTLNLTFSDATAGVSQCRYSNTQPVTSTYESCQVLKVWTTTTSGGTKTVFYEVRDNAGNTNISNDTITLDTSVPEMIITSPAPGGVVNGTINITFSGAESTQPQVSFDGSNWSNTTAANFHIWNTTNLSEGTHSIRVRDTDPAGNIGYSEPLLVIVNNIQGIVSFITPQNNEILTGNVIVRVITSEEIKNVSFVLFNTTSGQSIQVYNDTSALDGWNFTLNTALYEDGVWELKANATNSFNVLIDAAIVNNLRFDNVAPTATLRAPADGVTVRGTVIINVTASSDAKQVVFEYSNDSGTGWQPIGVDFSPVASWTIAWDTTSFNDASTYRIRANVSDYAGLSVVAQNTADFTVDNTPPKLTIIVPAAGSTVSGTVNVSFSGGERHPMVSIDGSIAVNASSLQNYTWNTASVADGAHTVRVNDSDALGNIGYSDTVLVYVDNTPDVVSIVSPPRTTASATGNLEVIVVAPSNTRFVLFNISNSTFNNMTVAGVQGITNDTTPSDGWRQTVTTAAFADGLYNISVAAYNELGNLTGRDNLTNIEFDNSAPTAPALRALPQFDTDGVVQLEWSNVTASVADVIYYNVYRSANISFALSAATRIKNVSRNFNTTTDFPGVNAKYYYKVTAVDNALHESAASNEENTTISVTEAGALVGVLSVNDSIVKDGDALIFKYSSSATDLNVTVNTTQMQLLDNASRLDLRLADSGAAPDAVADDAVYTANFTISTANNQSDGNVQLQAIVNDSANNQFLPTVNLTLDNTAPNASIIINSGDSNTSSATVTLRLGFNDTLGGVQSCRLAGEDRQFGEWEPCVAQRSWALSSGSGLKTVVVQVKDNADNVNETNDTITYQALAAVTIIRPVTDAALAGNVLIEAVGPATAAKIEFRIYNGTLYWPVGGGSTGSTNDSTPETGFSATWATSSFVDTIYNLTAIAYDASGNYIANDTNTNIEVDNTAPAAVTVTPLPGFFNKNTISLNWSPSSSSDVVYYNVYRSNNVSFALSSGALLKNVSSNSTVDVVLDGQWFYKVTAVDNTGRESAPSNEVNVTVITGAPPSELYGTLSVNATVVRNGSSVLFTFSGSATNLNATINQSEMQRLDNNSGALLLNDSGINGDYLADDAAYSGIYTLSMLNNVSDGMKQLTAEVNDSAGNLFRPKVNITLDNTMPNVSITVFGQSPAGFSNFSSEYTFSRAVTLVTSFNDTFGISSCRFANENQAFTDWEGCTTAKGWLLSDVSGNKTVILEVRDVAGNVNRANDTIYLNTTAAGLDQTPPTTPTVVDDGLYTSVNVALHAKWNSTDYENDLLHIPLEWEYRIAFDNFTRRINDTWQYAGIATEATVYGLNLSDGANYTLEVRAINTAGLRSTNGTSDGIIVDTTPPSSPLVNSTASQTAWTSSNAVTFNFTATDNVSGVSSFSYVLDANATTIPDNVPESMNQHTQLSGSYNDGKSTLLKFNSTGNASAVFVEVKSNASANDVVRVTLQLAESSVESPDAMGFVVYVITSPPTGFDMTGSNVSRIVNTSQDIAFASSVLDATSYTVDVPIGTAVAGSRFFVAVAGDQNDDNNRLNLLLSASNTSIGSSTQSYQCREGVSGCSNTTATADYGIKVELRDLKQDNIWHRTYTVGDGRLYFHVKAKDSAGNIGGTANYTVLVDTSPPSTPQMNQTSQYTNTTSATFNWTASTDADSGVGNYSLQVDNNSDFSSPEFYSWVGNVTNRTVTGLTADATYFARVHSSNLAGVNSSWSNSVSAVIDTTAPSITFSKPSSTGVVASQDVTLAAQTNERAVCTYSGNGGADPYQNFTYTNSTYHEARVSAATGANTFSVQCKDTVLNTGTATLSFTVSTSSTASSITLHLPSQSVFTGDVVRTNATVTTSSSQLLGEIGSAAFTVKLNGDAVALSVFDNGAGNYTLVFDAPSTNGTYAMAVTVGSATASATLSVQALLFTVQYVQSGVAANTGDRLIYFVAGNFSLGLATDSKNVMRSSTSSALNLTSNARDGAAYIFVTRTGGNVERVESLLKEQKFLDAINPSFGYAISLDTFVVYTDLEYDSIALSGNKTLTTGRYNLIIENKGFDTTVNKTKLEVRVQ